MRVIAEHGCRRLGDASPSSIAPTVARWRPSDATALVLRRQCSSSDFLFSFISPAGSDNEELAQLERLVPKIERAHTLSPDATQTISRLIERQSVVGRRRTIPSHQMRRKAAIERLIRAMQAKQDNSTAGTVAAAMSE